MFKDQALPTKVTLVAAEMIYLDLGGSALTATAISSSAQICLVVLGVVLHALSQSLILHSSQQYHKLLDALSMLSGNQLELAFVECN